MRIFKIRVALLGVLALFIGSGITASTASAAGPYWHVSGSRLGQGASRQVKLQLKGIIIFTEVIGGATVETACKKGISEGATIEGQGSIQGQGKGRLSFAQCEVISPAECTVAEPIMTVQTKSHLAYSAETQKKYVEYFEPQQGTKFISLKFSPEKACGVIAGTQFISGTVAAEVSPIETEAQEGLLNFPAKAIKHIVLEQQEKTNVGLSFAGAGATFRAVYGARLESGEPWGVFGR